MRPSLGKEEKKEAAGVSFCLSNNIWGTNYVMWNPVHPTEADLAFRFTLATERAVVGEGPGIRGEASARARRVM